MRAAQTKPILLQGVSSQVLALSGFTCLGGLAFGTLEAWPLWATGLAAVLPWIPVFVRDLARVYARYQWLSLFYALVVTQTGHLFEHISQMTQMHLLGLSGPDASGIFGAFNVEWVHFTWNTWVIFAVAVLLSRFGSNRLLVATVFLAGWHEIEHAYIFYVYLHTGVPGLPGLLAQGGAIAGGLPIGRADLHFLYNLVETVPLVASFFVQIQQAEATVLPAIWSSASRRARNANTPVP